MRLSEVDERVGRRAAAKWVWVARPDQLFEDDGTEKADLAPVADVLPEHFGDEQGWWTCHPETRAGDLAVVYRSGGARDDGGLPRRGPRDIRYVALATSDAFPLKDDPLAGEFAEHHGCQYVVIAEFMKPIGIEDLRADEVVAAWPALRAGFVQSAMRLPEEVWQRLLRMRPTRTRRGPKGTDPLVRRQLEQQLEQWLVDTPDALARLLDGPVEIADRQLRLGDDHGGIVDLLLRRHGAKGSYVVLELKADVVRRDAVAQVLGYKGWLEAQQDVSAADAVVLGVGQHPQVPWVLEALDDLVDVRDWSELDLPDELRTALQGLQDEHAPGFGRPAQLPRDGTAPLSGK